jgi:hypothetical protein
MRNPVAAMPINEGGPRCGQKKQRQQRDTCDKSADTQRSLDAAHNAKSSTTSGK